MLLWLLLMACHAPPREVPVGEVTLGWRLAPGMELAYRHRTTHVLGDDTAVREEVWHYLVRSVDDQGTFILEGHLESLDASITADGVPVEVDAMASALDDERSRLAQSDLTLSLSLDGRMDRLEAADWTDALPHRLLALRLPAEPVLPGSRWNDTETARPFTRLIPTGFELDIAGTHRLEQLRWQRDARLSLRPGRPRLVAELDTQALLRPEDARIPALDIHGATSWDLEAGRLATRSLYIIERGGTAPELSGSLLFELEWIEPGRAHRSSATP